MPGIAGGLIGRFGSFAHPLGGFVASDLDHSPDVRTLSPTARFARGCGAKQAAMMFGAPHSAKDSASIWQTENPNETLPSFDSPSGRCYCRRGNDPDHYWRDDNRAGDDRVERRGRSLPGSASAFAGAAFVGLSLRRSALGTALASAAIPILHAYPQFTDHPDWS